MRFRASPPFWCWDTSVAGLVFGQRGLYVPDPATMPAFLGQDALSLIVGLPLLLGAVTHARIVAVFASAPNSAALSRTVLISNLLSRVRFEPTSTSCDRRAAAQDAPGER
jgi:hypothetical protein